MSNELLVGSVLANVYCVHVAPRFSRNTATNATPGRVLDAAQLIDRLLVERGVSSAHVFGEVFN